MEIDETFLIRDETSRSLYDDDLRAVHHRRVVTLGNARRAVREFADGVVSEIPSWWRVLLAGLLESVGAWLFGFMGRVRTIVKAFLFSRIGELQAAALKTAEYFGLKTGGGVMEFLKGKFKLKLEKVAAVSVPLAFEVAHWHRLSGRIEQWRYGVGEGLILRALKQRTGRRYRRKVKSRG